MFWKGKKGPTASEAEGRVAELGRELAAVRGAAASARRAVGAALARGDTSDPEVEQRLAGFEQRERDLVAGIAAAEELVAEARARAAEEAAKSESVRLREQHAERLAAFERLLEAVRVAERLHREFTELVPDADRGATSLDCGGSRDFAVALMLHVDSVAPRLTERVAIRGLRRDNPHDVPKFLEQNLAAKLKRLAPTAAAVTA